MVQVLIKSSKDVLRYVWLPVCTIWTAQKLDPPRQNLTINGRILLRSNENIAIKRSRKYTIIFVGFPIWFWSKLIFSWLELCIQNLITYVRSWIDNNNIDFKSRNIIFITQNSKQSVNFNPDFTNCNKIWI